MPTKRGHGTRFTIQFVAAVVLVLSLTASALAADDDDEDELPDYRPGLVATYQAAGGKPIVRRDDDVQFVWRAGSPDPRIPPGPFQARWQGRLFAMSSGKYQLHVYAQGRVRLSIAGKTCFDRTPQRPEWVTSDPLALQYGYHPIELEFEKTGAEARVGLYWSGPQFQLEPLTERNLVHEPNQAPDESFEHGRLLARALRCDACHGASTGRLSAADLTQLAGNVSPQWLVGWLTANADKPDENEPVGQVRRRMPHVGLTESEARAIAALLLAESKAAKVVRIPEAKKSAGTEVSRLPLQKEARPKAGAKKSKKPKPRTQPSAKEGEQLLDTVGCLACHRVGNRGVAGLFGGGDLTRVAEKRPADFFARWLADPAAINPAHRMPVFKLSDLERQDLALYLATLKGGLGDQAAGGSLTTSGTLVEQGRRLVEAWRCAACHQLPAKASVASARLPALSSASRWGEGCLSGIDRQKDRPSYALSKAQQRALRSYYSQLTTNHGTTDQNGTTDQIDGQFVLAERNCLGCHARGLSPGIAGQSAALTAARPELAPLLPALAPPTLAGVGDKLHDEALEAAILLKRPPLREWLKIRMPRFPLSDDEMHAIIGSLVDHDRVPALPDQKPAQPADPAVVLAGSRLVTSDGFGCTSCHKIGSSEPLQVTLAAHGTDLSMVGSRIRRPWFDRWVRNPARIVPRMEMPAIQFPVRGVLDAKLPEQLSAVWDVLNTAGFEPPLPNPVRVVRRSNMPDKHEPAVVLTDVIEVGKQQFLRPIVIGLPNRQNILFDLETNRLAAWWIGDTARQRTRGKSWYWEAGGKSLLAEADAGSELRLKDGTKLLEPMMVGQAVVQLKGFKEFSVGVELRYQLQFKLDNGSTKTVDVASSWQRKGGVEFERRLSVGRSAGEFIWYPLPHGRTDAANRSISADAPGGGGITVSTFCPLDADGGAQPVSIRGSRKFVASFQTTLTADQFPVSSSPLPPERPETLGTVPGFEAVQLPLPRDEMPTGLSWRRDGTLMISSLKGRVCVVHDTDGDGLEDEIKPFSDELAAPYGLSCDTGFIGTVDVINKYGLLRLHDHDDDGHAESTEVLADGWGYTDDYHDWAVGLPRDREGNYYIALPCQQDERSEAAARLRGWALKLVPQQPSPKDWRSYSIEQFAGGLRFPMGLALNRSGDLFATDNQGNYTPFNELNHLVAGARYGFINKLEVKPGFSPPFRRAAIDIPHPWMRSINGICFLYTPDAVEKKLGRSLFGPFEGHLVGCEYNNRALVRMSLEKIGDDYQGAVYPFSRAPAEGEETFEGPVVCAIAPDGDLYVGNLRDSAWGGGQNTGSIVRLRPEAKIPPGIAEVRAAHDGFTIQFTQPADARAADASHYSVVSYRRIPTPAYGGPDVDNKPERVRSAKLAEDKLSVRLVLDEMRPGFVYEIRLIGSDSAGKPFFPAEAYYTLRQVPK